MPTPPTDRATYQRATLANGLPVVLRPMEHAQSAAVGIWVRAGGRYEPREKAGVFHFLEHLLFKGTRTRSCEQLKQAVEGVGGELNGFTTEEFTCYLAKVPAAHLDRAITVLTDMALHPALGPRAIEKEREVILEEIRMYDDSPAQRVHDLFNQLLWPNHPLGNQLAGSEETVRRMTRRDLVGHWRRAYHPRNMLMSVAGAFDPPHVRRRIERACAGARGGAVQRIGRAPTAPRGPQVRLVAKSTEQTHLCLGTPSMSRSHPLRFALELLHVVLGANMSSRLFREVRERRGLVYDIGTEIKRYHDAGAFVIDAGCDAAKLTQTLRTVLDELARIKRRAVDARELRRAKDFYTGQLLMSLEDTMDHMLWMGEQALTTRCLSGPRDLIREIERVTASQVQCAAQRLFRGGRLFLAALGPVAQTDAASLRRLCGALR